MHDQSYFQCDCSEEIVALIDRAGNYYRSWANVSKIDNVRVDGI